MPRIPEIQYSGVSYAPTAAATGINPLSKVGDQGGAAIERLGQAAEGLGSFLVQSYHTSQAIKATADAQEQLQTFTENLKNGELDPETMTRNDAPDPTTHMELYRQEVDRIRKETGDSLSGGAAARFNANFDAFAFHHRVVVQEQANQMIDSQIKVNYEGFISEAAKSRVNGDEVTKNLSDEVVKEALGEAVDSGVYTPMEAHERLTRYVHETEMGSINKMMKEPTGPEDIVKAVDNGEFNLPQEVQQRVRAHALDESVRRVDKQHKYDAWTREDKERADKKLARTTEASLWAKYYNPKGPGLKPTEVLAAQDILNVDEAGVGEFKSLMAFSTGRGAIHDDPLVSFDLTDKILKGQFVRDELSEAGANGKLTAATVHGLQNLMATHSPEFQQSNIYNVGKQYIDKLNVQFKGDMTAAPRLHKAEIEWSNWVIDHPKSTQEDAQKSAESIVDRYGLVDLSKISSMKPLPEFFKAGRQVIENEDDPEAARAAVKQAAAEIDKAFEEGKANGTRTKRWHDNQWANINDWLDMIDSYKPKPKTKTGAKK